MKAINNASLYYIKTKKMRNNKCVRYNKIPMVAGEGYAPPPSAKETKMLLLHYPALNLLNNGSNIDFNSI